MMKSGKDAVVVKEREFPGGPEYNNTEVYPHYKEFGW